MKVKDIVREDDGEAQELVLTIVATEEEVKENADKFFKEIAQREIPGFRKGKAPRSVLIQSVGGHKAAMGGVAEMLINELAFKAIDDADVIFLGDPQFNVEQDVEEGKPFTFTVSGPVAPIVKLASDGPVSIEMPPDAATDAEIDRELARLQDYYHSFEDIEDVDHVAEMGDYAMVELTVTNHDKPLRGLSGASRMIGLGEGIMPESFDEKVVGSKVGDVLEFDFEAKDENGESEFGDGNLHAVVEVKSFRRRLLPDIGTDLAARMGCGNEEELRTQMRYTIDEQKNRELPDVMVGRVLEALVERIDGEVPEYFVDFQRQDVGRELIQGLEQQGTSLQQWLIENNVNSDQIEAEVSEEAARRAAVDCALEALFAAKGWELTEEDIAAELGEGDGASADRKAWEDANRMADLRKICRRTKCVQWLVKTAEVTVVEEA